MTTRTILLVEDNPITRKMVRHALENKGYAVLEAGDQATALRLAQGTPAPELVLMDLVLPDGDGFSAAERLRATVVGSRVPILAFSGFLSKAEEARMSAFGFDDVITKPVEPSRLLQIIQAHLPDRDPEAERFGTGRSMVLADDDPIQLKLARFRLQRFGFDVIPAGDGMEALALARKHRPDVIVSDVMMPRLDGFGLCQAVRSDEVLRGMPLVLMTNTYVEDADRELARRVGAAEMVLRTPGLEGLVAALATALATRPPVAPESPAIGADVERERSRRIMHQLERQVSLNAGLSQRCATMAAELSVLGGISDALSQNHEIEQALDAVLSACFDAGGISRGALYLVQPDGQLRARTFGDSGRDEGNGGNGMTGFFGRDALLRDIIARRAPVLLPAGDTSDEVLAACDAGSALIVPLVHGTAPALGALFLVSSSDELTQEDRIAFAQSVAHQIALALALATTFAEKAASERAALAHSAVLRSILDSIADGVVVVDETGRFIHWNRAGEQLVRAGGADQKPLARAMRGEAVDRAEGFLVHADFPEGIPIMVTARPLVHEDGSVHGAVAVVRDVTDEKKAQAQLMVSDRMASIGMLAAGVAHEINNPLAAAVANLELAGRTLGRLRGELDSPRVAELAAELGDAVDATDRVRQIVKDLKVFSRSEDDQRGPVDVQRILESTLRLAWNEIRHRARLVRNYQEVPAVDGNEPRLGQVFLNLIVNAAQAVPEGRAQDNEIRVSLGRDERGRVVVEVADTGSGMTAEVKQRLFTPFFTTKPTGVGTGLGLSICQRIVTGLGGEITVDSQPGKGTAFRVHLEVSARELPAAAAPAATAATRRGKVLVIDDERMIGDVIRRILQADHDVSTLTTAREALDRIAGGQRFDLILCDLMMPQVSGADFYELLHREVPEQAERIVFLSGGAFTAEARAFLDRVPNQAMDKPIDLDHLLAVVNDRIK